MEFEKDPRRRSKSIDKHWINNHSKAIDRHWIVNYLSEPWEVTHSCNCASGRPRVHMRSVMSYASKDIRNLIEIGDQSVLPPRLDPCTDKKY